MYIEEVSSRFSNWVARVAKNFSLSSPALPSLVGISLGAATLCLWQALLAQESAHIEKVIRLEAANAKFEITRKLEERTLALVRKAERWDNSEKLSKEEWEADAALLVQHYGGYQAIQWVDSSFNVRWFVPLAGNETAQNLNLLSEARRQSALEAARDQRQVEVTHAIDLVQGGKGFQVYVPIFQKDKFDGFIVGVFRTNEFVDTIFNDLDKVSRRKYALTIFDGNEKIYSHELSNRLNEKKWSKDTTINFYGVTWRMRITPEPEWLAAERSHLPEVTLVVGLVIALLLPWAIHLAQIAQRRAKKVEVINEELENKIISHQRAEQRLRAQYTTARVLAESDTLGEAMPQILQTVCDILGWDIGELWSVEREADAPCATASSEAAEPKEPSRLKFIQAWSKPSVDVTELETVTQSITFTHGVGLPGRVWESGEPIWVADVLEESNFVRAAVAAKAGLQAAFGFPILDSNQVLGVITFFSREIQPPDKELLEMVRAISRQIGQFMEHLLAKSALEQQRQWLAVTLNSIGDAVIATDTTSAVTFMNPVAEALTGWSDQEAKGQKIETVFQIIDASTRLLGEIPVERALLEGVVVELAENTLLIGRDRTETPIDDSCAPIRNGDGTVQGAVLIFRDITKRKLAEADLKKALAKEKELNSLKSRFISMTSHEFRTPLTTILSSAELLQHYSHKWTQEKKLNHLRRIQGAVKHQIELLDDVLFIGKADAGRVEFNPAPLDLKQFCLSLVEEMQLMVSKEHNLTFICRGQCTDAWMDEKLLRHIFSNLLSNAIKYSPDGGTVHFELACSDGEAISQVIDSGIGIPKEDLLRLFESFHRAKNVGNIAGTGLGLAIVKNSLDLQGGTITVESEVGVGTTFTVTLPLNQGKQDHSG